MSRVVEQQEGEQGYHACYYVTACAPPELRAKLAGVGKGPFRYLCTADPKLAQRFDAEWAEVNEKLATMLGCGREDAQVVFVWKVVVSVLLLGQIDFDEVQPEGGRAHDPGSAVAASSTKDAASVAELLGCSAAQLTHALCTKRILKRDEPRTKREAEMSRSALAKSLYDRLFNLIIEVVNAAFRADEAGKHVDLFSTHYAGRTCAERRAAVRPA
jgi:myosin heavy subunit